MEEIGGFFQLELRRGESYHPNALQLNTGRNALEYILRRRGYKKLWLPYYCCGALLEAPRKLDIPTAFYHIGWDLAPVLEQKVGEDEALLYINYFGICPLDVAPRLNRYVRNIIVDNSQAFFARPLRGFDTFYSPRKFFGVPDGGYLYWGVGLPGGESPLYDDLPRDESSGRMEHLLKRIELGAQAAYAGFKANEESLCRLPIKQMSLLTRSLLYNTGYEEAELARNSNFHLYHFHLKGINCFDIPADVSMLGGPMIYPLLVEDKELKHTLIRDKIYVATYWPEVLDRAGAGEVERTLTEQLVPLPLDQRYGKEELGRIIEKIRGPLE